MSQTPIGAARAAATHRGDDPEEAAKEYQQGKWHCGRCHRYLPFSEFGRDRSRASGRTPYCRTCRNRRERQRYVPVANPKPFGPRPNAPRMGDKKQARRRINVEVRTGRRPHPNTMPCTDCGHKWRKGERRHEYDHHLGYDAIHHYDVEAVCTTCHARREKERNERREVP